MWKLKFQSWKLSTWTLDILTLKSFKKDWLMARAIRAKCFVTCSTTTIAKIIETFKWVQVVITDTISYQICNSCTLVIVKSGMFKSWQEVPVELHVSILTQIKSSQFFFVKADFLLIQSLISMMPRMRLLICSVLITLCCKAKHLRSLIRGITWGFEWVEILDFRAFSIPIHRDL